MDHVFDMTPTNCAGIRQRTMPWIRQVTGLSQRRPGFNPRSANVEFVAYKVAAGLACLRVFLVPPVSIIACSRLVRDSLTMSLNNALERNWMRDVTVCTQQSKDQNKSTDALFSARENALTRRNPFFYRRYINDAVDKNHQINHK